MTTERTPVEQRAARHAALGDPARLRIVELLTLGDRSPGELRQSLDLASNLLAHHLTTLERADLITRSPSQGDRRRSYIHLNSAALHNLTPGLNMAPDRIVFICTGNAARSPLAAALWSRTSTIPVTSAGTHPTSTVSTLAIRIAARHGLDIRDHTPRRIDERESADDLLITLCDRAHEELRNLQSLHWSIPNPGAIGTESAYEHTYTDLHNRIAILASHLT
ncbi:helix-turn-helix domain-containing protein [Brevibacterium casei]|uniref:arsenate reductase/protein-tyrosine-phosphatase family protein n=1 Tax=Brevibacterium casei TaxID=33889 RepID=UPI000E6562C8|nr:helix-turn-helix domain-containing protein [Brevibacterium casei]MBE4696203.1 helix-turn-helix domain-containing protein [Brevibacterium casei]MBY3579325.1 helix-turn-helix domain-containing protein [Brevibacterium casei]